MLDINITNENVCKLFQAAGAVTVLGVGTPPARLGQSCLNEGQCSRSVANSTCSSGTCSCKPYYAEYEGSCLPCK